MRSSFRKWNPEEDQTLRELYPSTSSEELQTILHGRSAESIRSRAERLGIKADDRRPEERIGPELTTKHIASVSCGGVKKILKQCYSKKLFDEWLANHRCRGLRIEHLPAIVSKHPFQRYQQAEDLLR